MLEMLSVVSRCLYMCVYTSRGWSNQQCTHQQQ